MQNTISKQKNKLEILSSIRFKLTLLRKAQNCYIFTSAK